MFFGPVETIYRNDKGQGSIFGATLPTDILSLTFEVLEHPEGMIEGPKKRQRKISSIS